MDTQQYQEPKEYSIFEEMEQNAPINYASMGQRFANYVIDFIVFYLATFIFGIVLAIIQRITESWFLYELLVNESAESKFWMYLFASLVFIITYTFIEGVTKGRSLGKLITGTKAVMEENGTDITWAIALKRSLCRIVPFEPFSALGGTPWHDKWTGTTVIRTR